jgi:hypothetical protein
MLGVHVGTEWYGHVAVLGQGLGAADRTVDPGIEHGTTSSMTKEGSGFHITYCTGIWSV